VAEAIAPLGIPILGSIPATRRLRARRHLGLVRPASMATSLCGSNASPYGRASSRPRCHPTPGNAPSPSSAETVAVLAPPGSRIAIAQDETFSFVYPHVLMRYQAGAEIVPFSPLADKEPPAR
jgi:cobyrinic acid a,c-diamide synthase